MKGAVVSVLCGVFAVLRVYGQDKMAVMERVMQARPFGVRTVAAGGVRLELRGIYEGGGLLWVCLRAENRSSIDFRPGSMRFTVRDRRSLRRRARQEMQLAAVVRKEVPLLGADSAVAFCYGLVPRAPGRRQELVVEWMERNGDRRLELRVPGKMVLRAKRL